MIKWITVHWLAFKYWLYDGENWKDAIYIAKKIVYWSDGKGI